MSRSHNRELLALPRPRNACDRCHLQKLRCLKAADGAACLRCAKFGTSCIFSPRSLRRKPQTPDTDDAPTTHSAVPTPPPVNDPLHLWPDLPHLGESADLDLLAFPNFNDTFSSHMLQSQPTLQGQLGFSSSIPAVHASMDVPSPTLAEIVRQLTDLHVELLHHIETFPVPVSNTLPPQLSHSSSKTLALDKTFAMTKSLVDILRYLNANRTAIIDQATVLLFLSCFYRLMDIYERLFISLPTCIQHPRAPTPEQGVIKLPQLQFGTYIPSQVTQLDAETAQTPAVFTMHVLVLTILSIQLCEQLRDATSADNCRATGEDPVQRTMDGSAQIPTCLHSCADMLGSHANSNESFSKLTHEAIRKRLDEVTEKMRVVKQTLLLSV